jgi:hypothetical protein
MFLAFINNEAAFCSIKLANCASLAIDIAKDAASEN